MNHAPRFTIGQEVITPRHGVGVIKWVYPAPLARVRNRYSVILRARRDTVVMDEQELQPRLENAAGPEVCCRDCVHNNKPLRRTSILCPVINQYRKPDRPRICKHFTAQPTTKGA